MSATLDAMGSPSPERASAHGTAAAADLLEELRIALRERRSHALALRVAVGAVPHPTLLESLERVANELPLAVETDFSTIRLADANGVLHVLATAGLSPTDVRARALHPMRTEALRRLTRSGTLDIDAAAAGISWIRVLWIGLDRAPIGAIALGARTLRRPALSQLHLAAHVAQELAPRLASVDRSVRNMRTLGLKLARLSQPVVANVAPDSAVAQLRPRERAILGLYAEGLTTDAIAQLLVISTHTVRTHVKSALRTLAVHNREEAAQLVRVGDLVPLL
jgi:DNA-binding CsgD family transcriptional regulator